MCHRCRVSVPPSQKGFVLWALCNPSKANAEVDDPTEGRGWGFTSGWGYTDMVFVNTSPVRETNPKIAARAFIDPDAWHENEVTTIRHARAAALIICAWGANAAPYLVRQTILALQMAQKPLHYLELTKHGIPKHPLYLSGLLRPKVWNP